MLDRRRRHNGMIHQRSRKKNFIYIVQAKTETFKNTKANERLAGLLVAQIEQKLTQHDAFVHMLRMAHAGSVRHVTIL